MNRIFMLILPLGIDSIQGNHDLIAINSRCRRRGIQHSEVCRGADDYKRLACELNQRPEGLPVRFGLL
jgi:hypothetical protein